MKKTILRNLSLKGKRDRARVGEIAHMDRRDCS